MTTVRAAAAMRSLTGIEKIWLVFRIGHTAEPPKSHRLSTEQVLVHD